MPAATPQPNRSWQDFCERQLELRHFTPALFHEQLPTILQEATQWPDLHRTIPPTWNRDAFILDSPEMMRLVRIVPFSPDLIQDRCLALEDLHAAFPERTGLHVELYEFEPDTMIPLDAAGIAAQCRGLQHLIITNAAWEFDLQPVGGLFEHLDRTQLVTLALRADVPVGSLDRLFSGDPWVTLRCLELPRGENAPSPKPGHFPALRTLRIHEYCDDGFLSASWLSSIQLLEVSVHHHEEVYRRLRDGGLPALTELQLSGLHIELGDGGWRETLRALLAPDIVAALSVLRVALALEAPSPTDIAGVVDGVCAILPSGACLALDVLSGFPARLLQTPAVQHAIARLRRAHPRLQVPVSGEQDMPSLIAAHTERILPSAERHHGWYSTLNEIRYTLENAKKDLPPAPFAALHREVVSALDERWCPEDRCTQDDRHTLAHRVFTAPEQAEQRALYTGFQWSGAITALSDEALVALLTAPGLRGMGAFGPDFLARMSGLSLPAGRVSWLHWADPARLPERWPELARHPYFSALKRLLLRLHIPNNEQLPATAALALLRRHPLPAPLQALHLNKLIGEYDAASLQAVLDGPMCVSLVELGANQETPGPLAEALAGAAQTAQLRALDLRTPPGDRAAWTRLLSRPLPSLRSLTLRCPWGWPEAHIAALCGAELPSLTTLSLVGIGVGGLERLLAAPWLPQLRTLRLDFRGWIHAALPLLVRSPALSGLEELDLGDNRMTPQDARVLSTAAHLGGLSRINLAGCSLYRDGFAPLLQAEQFSASTRRSWWRLARSRALHLHAGP